MIRPLLPQERQLIRKLLDGSDDDGSDEELDIAVHLERDGILRSIHQGGFTTFALTQLGDQIWAVEKNRP